MNETTNPNDNDNSDQKSFDFSSVQRENVLQNVPQNVSSAATKNDMRRKLVLSMLFSTIVLTIYLLVLSLGVYRTESVSWGDGQSFFVDSLQLHGGVPAWLTYNRVTERGLVPPLPESDRAAPGFQVHVDSLSIALLIAMVIGFVVSFTLIPVVSRNSLPRLAVVLLFISVVMVLSAFAGYHGMQDESISLGIYILYFSVPVSVVLASCIHRDYLLAVTIAVFVLLTVWWGYRISEFVQQPNSREMPPDIEWSVDGVGLAIGIVGLSLVSSAFVLACRVVSNMRNRILHQEL